MNWVISVLAVILRVVVEFIKGAPKKELPTPRPEDIERVRKLEQQQAEERRARLREIDEKLANADRATVDRVLMVLTGADSPNVN